MREVILAEIAAIEDRLDERESGGSAVAHRDSDRAIQLDHRRWFEAHEHIVEAHDLPPVRRRGVRCLGVDGGNRGLQRVRTDLPRRQRALHKRPALVDLSAVPERSILRLEQNQLAVGRRARLTPGVVQQHEREQADRFGFGQ